LSQEDLYSYVHLPSNDVLIICITRILSELVTIWVGNSFCVCICWAEVAVFPGRMGTRMKLPLLCNTACKWAEVAILGKGEEGIVFKFSLQPLLARRWSFNYKGYKGICVSVWTMYQICRIVSIHYFCFVYKILEYEITRCFTWRELLFHCFWPLRGC